MLEHVSKALPVLLLVLGANVIPKLHFDNRGRKILKRDNVKTIVEFDMLIIKDFLTICVVPCPGALATRAKDSCEKNLQNYRENYPSCSSLIMHECVPAHLESLKKIIIMYCRLVFSDIPDVTGDRRDDTLFVSPA
jgi:hypothetical protein